jgi:hypothetical protein
MSKPGYDREQYQCHRKPKRPRRRCVQRHDIPPSKRRALALHFGFRFRPATRRDKAQFTISLSATIETAHYRAAIASLCTGLHVCVMSALPPKADMYSATAHVCFGPIADSCGATKGTLFDHFVGDLLEMHRHFEAERLGCLDVDDKLKLRRRLHR